MPRPRRRRFAEAIKRGIDVLVSCGALILLAPILLVVGGLVRIKLGCPVLFTQPRPGLRGRPFLLYKFRTMTDVRDAEGRLLDDGVFVVR